MKSKQVKSFWKNLNKQRLALALIALCLAALIIFILITSLAQKFVSEDLNNSCSYSEKGVISTAAGSDIIYLKMPSYKVQDYVSKARNEQRCVYEVANTDKLLNVCKTHNNKKHCALDYLGLELGTAMEKAKSGGWYARLVHDYSNPNRGIVSTDDRSNSRANFAIKQNKVVQVKFY